MQPLINGTVFLALVIVLFCASLYIENGKLKQEKFNQTQAALATQVRENSKLLEENKNLKAINEHLSNQPKEIEVVTINEQDKANSISIVTIILGGFSLGFIILLIALGYKYVEYNTKKQIYLKLEQELYQKKQVYHIVKR